MSAGPTEILMACEGEQVERYLMPCVRADKRECFALTEPGAGSDIMSMATRAVADGGDYVLNGSKHFISTPVKPDFAIIFAATGVDETPKGERKRVTAFLVDVGTPGFDIRHGPGCTSYRGYLHFQLSFDDCRVPASQILGEEGQRSRARRQMAAHGPRLGRRHMLRQGRAPVGACHRLGRDPQTIRQTDRPLPGHIVQARRYGDGAACRKPARHRCRPQGDEGTMEPTDAAMVKLYCSEMLGRVADHTVQIYGGMGLMDEMPIERCGAMPGSSGSGTEPRRSSATSSPVPC